MSIQPPSTRAIHPLPSPSPSSSFFSFLHPSTHPSLHPFVPSITILFGLPNVAYGTDTFTVCSRFPRCIPQSIPVQPFGKTTLRYGSSLHRFGSPLFLLRRRPTNLLYQRCGPPFSSTTSVTTTIPLVATYQAATGFAPA